ncbi:fused DNA binding domain of the MerR-like transcription regulator and aldo/keto reductase family oxidoreductase [Phascolarctobacterium sp. CAG:266]|nr:fused DNA binding domain of the MerR-like transcription regulator and aldo/keto reductase family oxidoreductase [Phascolarctobacterium sp. CAG:266]
MTIKEIAARTGVSADTLRYYERMGIIPAVPRTSGGYRVPAAACAIMTKILWSGLLSFRL